MWGDEFTNLAIFYAIFRFHTQVLLRLGQDVAGFQAPEDIEQLLLVEGDLSTKRCSDDDEHTSEHDSSTCAMPCPLAELTWVKRNFSIWCLWKEQDDVFPPETFTVYIAERRHEDDLFRVVAPTTLVRM